MNTCEDLDAENHEWRERGIQRWATIELFETFVDFAWFLRSVGSGRWGRARKFHRLATSVRAS